MYHWEEYIRQQKEVSGSKQQSESLEPLYQRLQDIYTQIDEPDGIEGISAHLQVLNIDQQILEHRKAGRWAAAQSWYEMLLTQRPDDLSIQYNLLTSLKESGQYGTFDRRPRELSTDTCRCFTQPGRIVSALNIKLNSCFALRCRSVLGYRQI